MKRKPALSAILKSYWEEVVLETSSSIYNSYLEIAVSDGKVVLNSRNANYSYGNLQKVFDTVFQRVHIQKRRPENALILGLGAGSVVSSLYEKFDLKIPMDGVEIDGEVIRLARKWFDLETLEKQGLKVYEMDVLQFLEKNAKKYDLLLVDVFFDVIVPTAFREPEFIQKCMDVLNPGGLCLLNSMDDILDDLKWEDPAIQTHWIRVQERNRVGVFEKKPKP